MDYLEPVWKSNKTLSQGRYPNNRLLGNLGNCVRLDRIYYVREIYMEPILKHNVIEDSTVVYDYLDKLPVQAAWPRFQAGFLVFGVAVVLSLLSMGVAIVFIRMTIVITG